MEHKKSYSPIGTFLILTAAFVVVVAGMKSAQALVVPFVFSIFVSVISAPPLFWLTSRKVPTGVAIGILLCALVFISLLIGALVGTSIQDFSEAAPEYQEKLSVATEKFIHKLESSGIDLPDRQLKDYLNPGAALKLTANAFTELSGLLGDAFLILLTVAFMLVEASSFSKKINAIGGASQAVEKFSESLKSYFAIKTLMSLVTAFFIWVVLIAFGVDFSLLWALLAFLLNFIPTIGSIIAAIPAVLLALIQIGPVAAGIILLNYILVNTVVGNIIEPKYMGKGLGLSALVVFLSLVFWGWVWGPIGMLLSVPLTVVVKIALESFEESRHLAVMLGSDVEVEDA